MKTMFHLSRDSRYTEVVPRVDCMAHYHSRALPNVDSNRPSVWLILSVADKRYA